MQSSQRRQAERFFHRDEATAEVRPRYEAGWSQRFSCSSIAVSPARAPHKQTLVKQLQNNSSGFTSPSIVIKNLCKPFPNTLAGLTAEPGFHSTRAKPTRVQAEPAGQHLAGGHGGRLRRDAARRASKNRLRVPQPLLPRCASLFIWWSGPYHPTHS